MRLPGRERDLVAGFLASEGILAHADDLTAVEPCTNPDTGEPEPNVWNAALAPGVAFRPDSIRFGPVTSSCGLCGTRTLEELEKRIPSRPPPAPPLALAGLQAGFAEMRRRQEVFDQTAGVHAAALLGPRGEFLDLAEDVGRHNAVDKVLGARVRSGDYPVSEPLALLVSGRISFEIVQKAALAAVGAVAGVSAPTSLAVDSAGRYGLRLYGMVRDGGANLYSA